MGSGKSLLGQQLAQKLQYHFIDLDNFIETQEQQTISEMFKKQGEHTFRTLETHYLKLVTQKNQIVLSLGGGTPCFNNNMELIKEHFFSVYLKCDASLLKGTLQKEPDKRPLIKNIPPDTLEEFIKKKIEERERFYQQANLTFRNQDYAPEKLYQALKL